MYLGAVSVVGVLWAVAAVARAAVAGSPQRFPVFAVLVVLLVASEQRPLSVHRRVGVDTVSLSGVFACALLLGWNVGWAVAVQIVASLIDDLRSRRDWWKSVFNAAQYALSLGGAALVLDATGYGRPGASPAWQALSAVAAGFTFFLVNDVLPGIAIALVSDEPVIGSLRADLPFQASVNGAMTMLAPVVIAAADRSVWLVPLLLVPAAAVYRAARVSLEQDYRARHDSLTDLPNRFAFTDAVAELTAGSADCALAVLVMDLDSFKELNDTLGHSAGDQLLCQVGSRLSTILPDGATLARLGGDEFALLLPDASTEEATVFAKAALAALAQPFDVEGTSIDLHASIGVAAHPDHGRDPEKLLQHADVAMYVAKRHRSSVEIYAPERNHHTRRRLSVLNELRPALGRGQLSVHYQPQVDMATATPCSAEALLRWNHPDLGVIPPSEFITLAEHTGFIREITDFVLAESLEQLRIWRARGHDLSVAVNLSPQVLHDVAMMRRIVRTITDTGLPPASVVLELTETAVMSDPGHSAQLLREVADAGIRLSIDDFGTGYSALSYLSRLPVSEVKIDRSFVTHIDGNEANRHIVTAITQLAHNLGMTVVAEGIERVAEWQALAAVGCHVAQGFLIGRAVPPSEAADLLCTNAPLVDTFAVHFGVGAAAIG